MKVGTHVEVRNRFDARWSRGFVVAEVLDGDHTDPVYRIQRRSDHSVLPPEFDEDDLREERRRSTWWI